MRATEAAADIPVRDESAENPEADSVGRGKKLGTDATGEVPGKIATHAADDAAQRFEHENAVHYTWLQCECVGA